MRFDDIARKLAVGAVVAALTVAPAAAQNRIAPGQGFENLPRLGIGYVANAPQILTGASAYTVVDVFGGLGLYVDAKLNLETPEDERDFVDDLTVRQVEAFPGQEADRDERSWWSVNAALIRPLSPEFMVYLGAGYAYEGVYWRYRDLNGVLDIGTFGWYWVQDDRDSGYRVNFLAGMFFRMSERVAFQFGLESVPSGVTVGGSYSFPL